MLAEFSHHLVSGAQDFEIGQHQSLPSSVDHIAGVRDGSVGFAFQPEQRPCASAGALTVRGLPTPAVLSEACRAAVIPPLSEPEHETIPSQTARP
jgi:hypothetical protein